MSIQEVERLTQRALADEAFRERLRVNPEAALAEYELTPEELTLVLGPPVRSDAPSPVPTEPPA